MNQQQEAFVTVYNAYHEKVSFEQALKDYESKPLLQRIVSARPKDPAPGISAQNLSELSSFGFKLANPDLNVVYIPSAKDEHFKMRTEFEPNKGISISLSEAKSGFEYEENIPTNGKYWLATVNAEKAFMRPIGDPYADFFKSLQDFQYTQMTGKREINPSGVKEAVSFLNDVRQSRDADKVNLANYLSEMKSERKVSSPQQFVSNELELKKLRCVRSIVSNELNLKEPRPLRCNFNDPESRMDVGSFLIISDIQKSVDPVFLYRSALKDDQKVREVKNEQRPDFGIIMQTSKEQERLDAAKLGLQYEPSIAYEKYVENALNAGYSKQEIAASVNVVLRSEERPDFKPAYDIIETRVAGAYVRALVEQTDTAFGKGIKDASNIEVQSPAGRWQETHDRVSDMVAAREFLTVHQEQGGYTCDRYGHITYGNPFSLGETVYNCSDGLSLKAVSEVSGYSYEALHSGYMAGLGKYYADKMDESLNSYIELNAGAKHLRDEIVASVVSFSKDGKFEAAGNMLMDAGVVFKAGESVNDSVSRAVGQMYGKGAASDMNIVNAFREKYSNVINSARQQMHKSALSNKQVVKNGKGRGLKNN